jgi:5-methylthioadenosine/S-adenosylhomocysteine deaminase
VGADDLPRIWQWTQEHGTQFDIHAPSVMDAKYLAERRGWKGGCFEWLDREGMLGPSVLAIHAQNLRPGEHELIADRDAKISLVPDMELLLGLIDFQARPYFDHGVDVSLGLDGPVVAYHHNVWHAMKGLVMGQRLRDRADALYSDEGAGHFGDVIGFGSAELALELATIGGAKAIGMADRIGSLETGKQADLVVIDTSRDMRTTPPAALIPDLVYAGGPSPDTVERVMVGGKTVVRNGESTSVDRAEAVRGSNRVHHELVEETGIHDFVRKGTRWNWR